MSDQRVQQTQARLDYQAIAEMSEERRLDAITDCISNFMFDDIEQYIEQPCDFLEWIFDKFDNSDYAAAFYCIAVRDWKLSGNETDTRALAESFVDWIGE